MPNVEMASLLFQNIIYAYIKCRCKLPLPKETKNTLKNIPPESKKEILKEMLEYRLLDASFFQTKNGLSLEEALTKIDDKRRLDRQLHEWVFDPSHTMSIIKELVSKPRPENSESRDTQWLYHLLKQEGVVTRVFTGHGRRNSSRRLELLSSPEILPLPASINLTTDQIDIPSTVASTQGPNLPLIHVVWIGGELPLVYVHYLSKLIDLNPTGHVILWTDNPQIELECIDVRAWESAFNDDSFPIEIEPTAND